MHIVSTCVAVDCGETGKQSLHSSCTQSVLITSLGTYLAYCRLHSLAYLALFKKDVTVEFVYSSHPSEAAKWLLYTGGLLIEVFNVYVAHGKFRWDFPY